MALRKPVRNAPPVGSKHQCGLTAMVGDVKVDLTNETACKQAELVNGEIFTCEDIVKDAKGNESVCGKEWVLHYPTKFAWKVRRTPTAAEAAAAETTTTAQKVTETLPSGKRNK